MGLPHLPCLLMLVLQQLQKLLQGQGWALGKIVAYARVADLTVVLIHANKTEGKISLLPVALPNFASNQLAAAQFLSSRSVTPDNLLSMQPRRGEQTSSAGLATRLATTRTSVRTSNEGSKTSKDDPKDDDKASKDTTASVVEPDSDEECGGAWAAEEVMDTVMGGPLSIWRLLES